MQEQARVSPSSRGKERGPFPAAFLCAVACLVGAIGSAELIAGEERYDYDALGRLVRVIDEQGRVTQYVYDAAGNILQVITGGTAQPPAVTSISPTSIVRGETKQVSITGSGLINAEVTVSDPGLDIGGVQSAATQISFTLAAALTASLGPQAINIRNAAGTATASITVNPVPPKLSMAPQPVALPPATTHNFLVTLSTADTVDRPVSLVSANTAIATVSPASVTILAGQTQATVSVTGVAAGTTFIALSSPGLASTSVPVFVSTEATGIDTNFAPPVGVVVLSAAGTSPSTVGPLLSPLLVIASGAYIDHVSPATLAVGTGPTSVVISGNELSGVTGASVAPPDGLTLGAISVAPDGHSVTVPVTVAASAPTTPRRITLAGAQQPYLPARPGADQILVTLPPPQIFSIDPLFAATGTIVTLTIRGSNLQGLQAVSLVPGTGIQVDAVPSASADGTSASVRLSIDPLAPTGASVVRATTSGGTSTATASAANTFTVVNQIQSTISPIESPPLGVVLQSGTPPPPVAAAAFSPIVMVAVGSAVSSLSPSVGIIGQTTPVTITGTALQGVTAIQFSPPDGVTADSPAVSGDGLSATVNVTVAASAPQTIRAVQVKAGTVNVPFANPIAAQFRVSAPLAVIQSVTPNFLQTGAPPVTLTVRGLNFQNASAVGVVPPDGISINNPPAVDPTGTQITVNLSAAANAATGPRAVTVTTPAGTSSSATTPGNTITVTAAAGPTITPVTAASVGVVLQSGTPPPPVSVGPITAASVGVVLQNANPPPPPPSLAEVPQLGVAVGAVATRVSATPLSPSTSGTLTISGVALGDVTSAALAPPDSNVVLGTPTTAPDGTQVTVPITVQAGATAGLRAVQVFRATVTVPFTTPVANTFRIGVGTPNFDSISPILASRGQTFTMIIRGQNFQGTSAVTATPATGMFIDNSPTVNATGTEVDVRISIAPDAPLEAKVIQVITPSGASRSDAVPANTFTVQP